MTGSALSPWEKSARVLDRGRVQHRQKQQKRASQRSSHVPRRHLYRLALKVFSSHCISPVDTKRIPATEFPDARNSRIFPRFAPETFVACTNTCTASDNAVPSGTRKIHGILVDVSALSEEIATTGTKAFTPICSAK